MLEGIDPEQDLESGDRMGPVGVSGGPVARQPVVGGRGRGRRQEEVCPLAPPCSALREPAFAFSRRRGSAAVREGRREGGVQAPAGRTPPALGRHPSSPWRPPPSGPRWPLDCSSGPRATPCPPRWVPRAVHGERRPLTPTRTGAQTPTLGGPWPGRRGATPPHSPHRIRNSQRVAGDPLGTLVGHIRAGGRNSVPRPRRLGIPARPWTPTRYPCDCHDRALLPVG